MSHRRVIIHLLTKFRGKEINSLINKKIKDNQLNCFFFLFEKKKYK